ncbi:MAG: DUF4407 domain-containing protein [Bacteroidota bacterium]|nr:DUF4407 domain-containing protein [Bacteroidota bacterium]
MLRISSFITGEDYNLLKKDTPQSRKKVIALASLIMIPVSLWAVNGYLLVSHVLQGTLLAAVATSAVCGLLIFLVEKNIVMADGNWRITTFRIFIGFLIAMLGSLSWDEVIFKSDIDQQMTINKIHHVDQLLKETESNYQSQLKAQEDLVQNKYNKWMKSLEKASKEADGTGGSGVRGVEGITRLKLEIAKKNEEEYIQENQRLEILKNRIEAEKKIIEGTAIANFNKNSLLLRIKAMFDLVKKDNWMLIAYVLFTILLFCFEFIVVVVKLTWKQTKL